MSQKLRKLSFSHILQLCPFGIFHINTDFYSVQSKTEMVWLQKQNLMSFIVGNSKSACKNSFCYAWTYRVGWHLLEKQRRAAAASLVARTCLSRSRKAPETPIRQFWKFSNTRELRSPPREPVCKHKTKGSTWSPLFNQSSVAPCSLIFLRNRYSFILVQRTCAGDFSMKPGFIEARTGDPDAVCLSIISSFPPLISFITTGIFFCPKRRRIWPSS